MKVDKKGKVVPELKIHELRAETYNGMVRLLKPGCRTIVLIVDRESKEKLVPKFYKFAWPFRRNKTVMFGFLYIEKGDFNLKLPSTAYSSTNPALQTYKKRLRLGCVNSPPSAPVGQRKPEGGIRVT